MAEIRRAQVPQKRAMNFRLCFRAFVISIFPGAARRLAVAAMMLSAGMMACSGGARGGVDGGGDTPVTAQAFVAAYADAHLDEDVDRILDMQWETAADGAAAQSSTPLNEDVDATARERERTELREAFRNNDMWTTAWKQTTYVSEQGHGDHIHVEVNVGAAGSAIVLVKGADGQLFITENPSDYP